MPDNDYSLTLRYDDARTFAVNGDAPILVDMGDGTLRKVVDAHTIDDEYHSVVLVLGGEALPTLRTNHQEPLVGERAHGD